MIHRKITVQIATLAIFSFFMLLFTVNCSLATECGGHGHLHDGECHCDKGYKQDPQDKKKCITDQTQAFECIDGRDGWQQCHENRVRYCHIVKGMDPHFHWGANCQDLGLKCIERPGNKAVCLDESKTCTGKEAKCENNTAYNCVDGKMAVEPCGTAKECHIDDSEAHCEEKSSECGGHGHLHNGECHCDTGYKLDPNDNKKCIPE